MISPNRMLERMAALGPQETARGVVGIDVEHGLGLEFVGVRLRPFG